jgi:3'-phosphoadenosine 5'-phosphosulfate sulfotransferase (PAPS reductase)/FAD synthetase
MGNIFNIEDSLVEEIVCDPIAEANQHIEQLFHEAVTELKTVMKERLCTFATSFGVDSTLTLIAGLRAHLELIQSNDIASDKPFIVTNINTLVENHNIQILVKTEHAKLLSFCNKNQINLVFHSITPPVSKQWSSLFLSGLKLFSGLSSNSDCSIILKINQAARVRRLLEKKYQTKLVTVLGTNVQESQKRRQTMLRYGDATRTAADLIQGDAARPVFAPIRNWSKEDIWFYIDRAGCQPIIKSERNFFSYSNNHRLLKLVYGDASSSSCPVSDVEQKIAGCGQSARTGCNVCLKSTIDRSGAAQNEKKRHRLISGNITKVRDWIQSISNDINLRTWHTRAIDPTTNAVAMMPNVIRADIIEKALVLMSQVSVEDLIRAKRFQVLNSRNLLNEEAVYCSIIDAPDLSEPDKQAFMEGYLLVGDTQLIEPMSVEIAMYISAIHSRDGIALPPAHALMCYLDAHKLYDLLDAEKAWDLPLKEFEALKKLKTEQLVIESKWLAYPTTDLNVNYKVDTIPDSKMLLPEFESQFKSYTYQSDILDVDTDCASTNTDISETIPASISKCWQVNGSVSIRHLKKLEVGRIYLANTNQWKGRHPFSKRSILKCSRKKGQLKVLSRGRTSVGQVSFSQRSDKPKIVDTHSRPLEIYFPHRESKIEPEVHINPEPISGYDIDTEALQAWFDYGGYEKILEQHTKALRTEKFRFHSTDFFRSLARWGVLKFTENSKKQTIRILNRTNYFRELGLFQYNQQELYKKAISMQEYRSYKAKLLLDIRAERNKNRIKFKNHWRSMVNDPLEQAIANIEQVTAVLTPAVTKSSYEFALASCLIQHGTGFDDVNYKHMVELNEGWLKYVEHLYGSSKTILRAVVGDQANHIINDAASHVRIKSIIQTCRSTLKAARIAGLDEAISNISCNSGLPYWGWFYAKKLQENKSTLCHIERLKTEMHNAKDTYTNTTTNSNQAVLSLIDSLF